MEFRLIFDGDLRPRKRSSIEDIHQIRMAIHYQMISLWAYEPLAHVKKRWIDEGGSEGNMNARDEIDGQTFISVVSRKLFTQAELDILLLKAQPPGMLVTNQGDIDNRMKTLFDGLRVPTKSEAKELKTRGALGEETIFCLLQDDDLISRLTVSTDRLLGEPAGSTRTLAIINVKLRLTRVTWGNLSLT